MKFREWRDHWVEVDDKCLGGGITRVREKNLSKDLELEMNMTCLRGKSRAI